MPDEALAKAGSIPILILNWNNAADTLACLQSLQRMEGGGYEVYVLDNGSESEDRSALREGFPQDERYNLLTSPTNLGFTRGVNHLLETVVLPGDYEYVALLNNDTEVAPRWLPALLAEARKTKAGMVASRMINFFDREHMDNAGHFLLNTGEILPLGHDDPIADHDQPRANAGACAGAALYKVELFRELGLFDTFFRTGYEDAEFGIRATLCGYACRYAPDAIVYHKISRSINKIRDFQYTLKIQVDVFYTVLKCWPAVNLIINAPFFLFKIFVITLMNLVFGRWKFMRVLWTALYQVLIRDRATIAQARRTFLAKANPTLSWYAFQQKMIFFLWFDIRRFYKYVWKREKMVFEKY
jgi:GT2 family glycosyltransferase